MYKFGLIFCWTKFIRHILSYQKIKKKNINKNFKSTFSCLYKTKGKLKIKLPDSKKRQKNVENRVFNFSRVWCELEHIS